MKFSVRNGLHKVKKKEQMDLEKSTYMRWILDGIFTSHVFRICVRHSSPKWRARFRRVFRIARQFAWERGLKCSTGGEDGFYP